MIVEELKTNLMSLAILFHFLCAQHVSDINISIIRSVRLFCCFYHIGRIVLGSMCVGSFGVFGLEWYPCCRLQPATWIPLMMDILMSETMFGR